MPYQDIPPSSHSDVSGPINPWQPLFCRTIWGPFRVTENNKVYCVIVNENPPAPSDTLAIQMQVYKSNYYGPVIFVGQGNTISVVPPYCLFNERISDAKILAGTAPVFDSATPEWVPVKDPILVRLIGQGVFYHVAVANNVMYILYATLKPGSLGYNFAQDEYKIARLCLINERWLLDIEATPPWEVLFPLPDQQPDFNNSNNFIIALGDRKLAAVGQFRPEYLSDGFGGLQGWERIYFNFFNGATWGTSTLLYVNSEEKSQIAVGVIMDSNGLIHVFYIRYSYSLAFRELYHVTLTQNGNLGTPQLLYTFDTIEGIDTYFPPPRIFTFLGIEYIALPFYRRTAFLSTISVLKLNTTTLAFVIEDVASTNLIQHTFYGGGIRSAYADFIVIDAIQYAFWHERGIVSNACGGVGDRYVKYATSSGDGSWSAPLTFYGPGAPIVSMMVVAGPVETLPGSLNECEAIQPQYHHPM